MAINGGLAAMGEEVFRRRAGSNPAEACGTPLRALIDF
jgi:hypothetical protein